jgi:hypothetical protein
MSSATNGWNAVCALDMSAVNGLLLQQHLNAGSGSPVPPLQFATSVQSGLCLAEVVLAPPEMSFTSDNGNQQATFSMTVQSAMLMAADCSQAVWLPTDDTPLLRTVDLQIVTGTDNSLGEVAAIVPGTQAPADWQTFAQAVVDGVMTAAMSYRLGTILATNSGLGLEPASFTFALQSSADGSSSALLLLITTSGEPGSPAPLDDYPLAAGTTAALILSEEILFSEILPAALSSTFNAAPSPPILPATFEGQQTADGGWQIVATAGIANLGSVVSASNIGGGLGVVTVDENGQLDRTSCQVPLTGNSSLFIAAGDGTALQIAWKCLWTQLWANLPPTSPSVVTSVPMVLSYACASTPTIDPTTDAVTFQGTEQWTFSANQNANPPAWTTEAFNPPNPNAQLMDATEGGVFFLSFFPLMEAESINTFALANLLFPGQTALTLLDAAFPGDLQLTGRMIAQITIEPAAVTLAPEGQQTFTSAQAVTFWCRQFPHNFGPTSFSQATGLYSAVFTAPPGPSPRPIKVLALGTSGGAAVAAVTVTGVVPPPPPFIIWPQNAMLSPNGGAITITTTDAEGNPAGSTCVVEGDDCFATQVSTGVWSCDVDIASGATNPPFTITATLTSNADPSQSGTVDIIVATLDVITLTWGDGSPSPSSVDLVPGGTMQLSASVQSGYSDLRWAITPQGYGGTIVPMEGDPTQATLTAPAEPPPAGTESYTVYAYYADQDTNAMGAGTALFTVSGGGNEDRHVHQAGAANLREQRPHAIN